MLEPDQKLEIYEEPGGISPDLLDHPIICTLLGVSHDAVLIIDRKMHIVAFNKVASELFSFPPEDVQPRLVDITRNRDIYDCVQQALAAERRFERRIILQSGAKERSCDLRVESISANEDQTIVIGAVATLFDITKIEQLERTRREFFANLSHELRTPLTSIQSYAETLLSGAIHDKENNVKFLEIIARQAQRMQQLAKDISDLAAIESGQMQIRPKNLKLAEEVREVAELLKDTFAQKRVTFISKVDDDFLVFADPKALEQILFNLIQNAAHFNRLDGSITVEADVSGSYKVIRVIDTGIGIEPKNIPRIFERLFRVDDSRSNKVKGTGLGLAIVKHLVKTHGGSIEVESVPGRGSTFSVFLPPLAKI